ncbi:MAG: FemAB family XrtA/PEP-CTERM system-associated protein [Planctomycetota bacterium]
MAQSVDQLGETLTPTAMLHVSQTTDERTWNEYLARRGPGHLFHRAEWERVFGFYRLPSKRLAAMRGGEVVGVLPLVWQKSLLFGNQLVSMPCFDAAGVVADDVEARDALIDEARQVAKRLGAKSVMLKHAEPLDLSPSVRTDKVLMRMTLQPDSEALWKSFSPKVRNQVRKGEKSGLSVERGGRELLADFFEVYSINMRDLGSPSHHPRFFEVVFDAFPEESRLYVVRLDGKAIGAGFTMTNGDRLEIPWASSLREYNHYCVNHLMYKQVLEDACREGFRWFHFGRSTRNSGPYRFKKQWDSEVVQLYWYYLTPDADAPAKVTSPQESYGWGTRIWRRLPLWLARSLGPRIVAKVP